MKLARSTVSVTFNYSTGFSNDDFSSFKNSIKEARLLRNEYKIKMSQVIVHIYLQIFPSCIRNKTKICNI